MPEAHRWKSLIRKGCGHRAAPSSTGLPLGLPPSQLAKYEITNKQIKPGLTTGPQIKHAPDHSFPSVQQPALRRGPGRQPAAASSPPRRPRLPRL